MTDDLVKRLSEGAPMKTGLKFIVEETPVGWVCTGLSDGSHAFVVTAARATASDALEAAIAHAPPVWQETDR